MVYTSETFVKRNTVHSGGTQKKSGRRSTVAYRSVGE